jgi:hypothetical protein
LSSRTATLLNRLSKDGTPTKDDCVDDLDQPEKPAGLVVNGSLVTDTLGREIDGKDDGQPGGDFIATISGNRATAGGIPLVGTLPQPSTVPDAIDHVLARGKLTGTARSPGVRSEARLAAKVLEIHSGR